MGVEFSKVKSILEGLFSKSDKEAIIKKLTPKESISIDFPKGNSLASVDARWKHIPNSKNIKSKLSGGDFSQELEFYKSNIENIMGMVKLPVGIAGPLLINGLYANGIFFVPLATTEAALIASYTRGAIAISASGGCTTLLLNEGVNRTPAFKFQNLIEVGEFLFWFNSNINQLKEIANETTQHGNLNDIKVTVDGNQVYLNIIFSTADASGQNMVTIATQALCSYIAKNCPVSPQYIFLDGNMSGDKKASMQSFQSVRGKKVTSEVVIPKEIVKSQLNTSPDVLTKFCQVCSTGGVLSGTIGLQGHYANALAALYIATGQDAACVAESSVGTTRFEATSSGDLYVSVTLPNLIVGTVGGGTDLPTQKACLEIMGLSGKGNGNALAEVCAAICLAGEISISSAFCSGDFARAHELFARKRKKKLGELKLMVD